MSGDASTPAQDQNAETIEPIASPEVQETTVESGPSGTDVDPAERLQLLEKELQTLRAEHDTLQSQYMRIAADFDNFRKRQSRD